MESESIVERVAQAQWRASCRYAEAPETEMPQDERANFFRLLARAAISAMREPTEEMKEAGISAIGNPDVDMAFAEMIGAALK